MKKTIRNASVKFEGQKLDMTWFDDEPKSANQMYEHYAVGSPAMKSWETTIEKQREYTAKLRAQLDELPVVIPNP